ncbi:MAG: Mur ligase family protein [Candidatus Spechtbacterales bacterium]|nr:Mur ligase family protein [Candidatus Spechtbacterales bacterium]
MKKKLITILQKILRVLARLTIKRYKPTIVGITGSVGKTSTKRAVAFVLREERTVRFSPGNFNNELGMPLTILGDWGRITGKVFWVKVITRSVLNLLIKTNYPEILVLEYGADKPGDIKYLLEIAKPDISIITAVGDTPVHIEYYSSQKEVLREKSRLVKVLTKKDIAILNYDDPEVRELRSKTRAQVLTYGFSKNADLRVIDYKYFKKDDKVLGISFKVTRKDKHIDITLKGSVGKSHAYSAAAAVATGLVMDCTPEKIIEGLGKYKSEWGRMRIIESRSYQGVTILDDSYNASPLSVKAALDTLKNIPGKRKIAILGDMRELGKHSSTAHNEIGKLAAEVVDVLLVVGKESKKMVEGAQKGGLKRENIHHFNTAEEARFKIKKMPKNGDVILFKASRAIKLENLVKLLN